MGRPGRRRESHSLYKKKRLSSDARIIVALLHKQPQSRKKLCESAKISKSTSYLVCPALQDHKIIKETESGYALFFFSQLEKDIENALIRLMEKSLSFSVEELASEIGKPWSEIEPTTYGLLKKLGLRIKTRRGETVIEKSEGGTVLF